MSFVIISTLLFAYSIGVAFDNKFSLYLNKIPLKNLRRLWYALCICLFSWYLVIKPKPTDLGYNKLLIPNYIWEPLILFLIFMLICVIIDNLVIRATTVGEFRFGVFGGQFSEEYIKDNINQNEQTLDLLCEKVNAEFTVIQNIDKIVKDTIDRLNQKIDQNNENEDDYNWVLEDDYNWMTELEMFLQLYSRAQSYKFLVEVYDTDEKTLSALFETLNLKKSIAQEVKSNIRELSSTLCNRKDDTLGYEKDLLFIPVESYFLNRIVLIVLFGKDNLVYDENYIISNLIKIFESYCLKYLIELDLKETCQYSVKMSPQKV